MDYKLSDAEISTMQLLWSNGPMKAAEIAEYAIEKNGWKKNTTYTIINRLIGKAAVKRVDPGFICQPLCQKSDVSRIEARNLIDKLYNGSINVFMQAFLEEQDISREELEALKRLIEER